jgi:ligand-binding sensor domain-containing protein
MESIVDGVGNLWVVSNKGLFRWSEKKQLLEKLTEKEGLPHNDVSSLTFDREGSLWLST